MTTHDLFADSGPTAAQKYCYPTQLITSVLCIVHHGISEEAEAHFDCTFVCRQQDVDADNQFGDSAAGSIAYQLNTAAQRGPLPIVKNDTGASELAFEPEPRSPLQI